ncbi:prepilin-type N-terminal cleavage/methylation domain-containing protein [Propionivibrio dicarboxylicus]|uniref:MSHA biogenesis protein MshO n=1 Tax=Propionivibrio dicarboxylicus TaxID=83767 RepID=A0A1G8BXI7_9RHOO|nr:prepilin-type N-terminal cleavage/methylation domain-containing protein [Propionivibrio dicarboxylicus]SDH37783.1 MSHA biogenesis protein MshO [Propionivibrio dicarboxylicus]
MNPLSPHCLDAHRFGRARPKGFTLVEIVVVIVLTGILASSLTMFLKPATDAYASVGNRAALTDAADTALRRMADDIRRAVPNSIRSVSANCFQLVPIQVGGRYRTGPDRASDVTSCTPTTCSAPLDTTQASDAFDILSDLPRQPAKNDWVVVNNQNADDVYAGTNRAQIAAITQASPNGAPRVGDGTVRLTVTPKQFPSGYDGGRFFTVADAEQTVFYNCIGRTLYRTVATFDTGTTNSCPTDGAVVATNVSNCTFVYSPSTGMTSQNGLLWMRLELGLDGESVALNYGVHVDNVP